MPFSAILEDVIFENFFSNKIRLKNIGKLEVCFTFFPINIFCDKKKHMTKVKKQNKHYVSNINNKKKVNFPLAFNF